MEHSVPPRAALGASPASRQSFRALQQAHQGGRGWPLPLIHPLVACSFDRTPPLSPSPPHTHTASTATLPEPLPPSATGRVLDSETIFDSAERFRFEVGFRVQGLRGVRV